MDGSYFQRECRIQLTEPKNLIGNYEISEKIGGPFVLVPIIIRVKQRGMR